MYCTSSYYLEAMNGYFSSFITSYLELLSIKYEEGLIYLAHQAGAEVYPSIGGWSLSDPFPVMAADAESRATFASQCVDLIKNYNFDGIDLDWEYPGKLSCSMLLDRIAIWTLSTNTNNTFACCSSFILFRLRTTLGYTR